VYRSSVSQAYASLAEPGQATSIVYRQVTKVNRRWTSKHYPQSSHWSSARAAALARRRAPTASRSEAYGGSAPHLSLASLTLCQRVPLTVRPPTSGIGLGLFFTGSTFSPRSLQAGTFISLYAGEILTTIEARFRWSQRPSGQSEGQGNYTLSYRLPSGSLHIDPRHIGNVGRFLNHSCEPNCVIHVARWGGGPGWSRAAIFVSATSSQKRDEDKADDGVDKEEDPSGRRVDLRLCRCIRRRETAEWSRRRRVRGCRENKVLVRCSELSRMDAF